MQKTGDNHQAAIIIVHEIYGVNPFIKDLCADFKRQGYDVFCPNLLNGDVFAYEEEQKAYTYFNETVGFDCYQAIVKLIGQLKQTYSRVFVMGFSVGATIAWRCSETPDCDGIIGCYGSRIRDYLQLNPVCPVLLLFAEQDSFDVSDVVRQVDKKANVSVHLLQAGHGYMDHQSKFYNAVQARRSKTLIGEFLIKHQAEFDF